ncbi:ABC transporter permease [Acidisoma silvae]|uniref:Autoinducer 2 import system permease protein LsrD n=1 Tax=Acidisoma silvae TaxID=2802396 RepID=A0A963YU62_9PROT|nr:ABC transporter permease [Acidisoma silvae]MCB8877135.1 ABC transporter permease [Acidisoma silvae]
MSQSQPADDRTIQAKPGFAERRAALRRSVPLAVLILLVGLSAIIAPGTLSPAALNGFISDAAPLMILVIGSTIPILTGSIDLSVAGIASITGVMLVVLAPIFGPWTCIVVILLAILFGAFQGWLHAWLQIPSFITTLGTLSMLSGLSLLLSNATAQPLPDSDPIINLLGDTSFDIPNTGFAALALVAVLAVVMRYTRIGRDLFALGAGERAALMSGVRTVRLRSFAFAASAGCAALAGLALVSVTQFSSPTLAGNLLLLSIVGVVLGGTAISGGVGGLWAGVIGGLITAWLRVATVLIGVKPTGQYIVFGIMALIAVFLTTDRTKIGIIK